MTAPDELGEDLRRRLATVADGLIPPADGMPAPSSIDIGGRQLDAVVASRPDLVTALRRALGAAGGAHDPIAWLETLRIADPAGYEALVLAVVAGYYLHPEVKRLLGYPGQEGRPVSVDRFPDYAAEGLLERVYERGPIYRPTPPPGAVGR
jgi:hypothetical protein